MKKRILAMIPALIMLVSLCTMGVWADTMNFSDVEEGSWYEDYVEYCYKNGLMNGTSSTTFAPGVTTTRSMIIQTLYNLAGNPEVSGSSGFSDVVSGSWYEDALIWGEEKGIATGYGNGTFGPDDVVTREQMATFFYRYADICGYDVTDTADLSAYSDESEISGWAYDAVEWAVGVGLIQGTSSSTVSPGDDATRSELATILTRFNKNIVLAREGATVVDSGTCGDDLIWVFYSDGLLEISGSGAMDDYSYYISDEDNAAWTEEHEDDTVESTAEVMEYMDAYLEYLFDVTDDARPWADYYKSITEIVIGEGVTRIGDNAFLGCTNLTSVSIPDSVTIIGEEAFGACYSLENISLPDGLLMIEESAFCFCTGLESIALPDRLTILGDFAFGFCTGLSSVTIPTSVKSIGDDAFRNCSALADVWYAGTEEEWGTISIGDNNDPLMEAVIHYSSTGEEEDTQEEETDSDAPAEEDADAEDTEDQSAGDLEESEEEETEEDAGAEDTGDQSTGDPEESDEEDTAESDEEEDSEEDSEEAEVLGSGTCGDDLTWVLYSDGLLEISGTGDMDNLEYDEEAPWYDYQSHIIEVEVEEGVTSIGDRAFYECYMLTSITISDSVTSIGDYAFYKCIRLTNVTMGDGVTSIGDYAFYRCSRLANVTMGDGVTSIGSMAFFYCISLESFTVPSGVTRISAGTFWYCTSLESVTIPDSVTEIGASAFDDCEALMDVYYSGTEEEWEAISIYSGNDYLTDASIHYGSD